VAAEFPACPPRPGQAPLAGSTACAAATRRREIAGLRIIGRAAQRLEHPRRTRPRRTGPGDRGRQRAAARRRCDRKSRLSGAGVGPAAMSFSPPQHIRDLIDAEVRRRGLARVTDYLIVTAHDLGGGRVPAGWDDGPVDLSGDMRIERLDPTLAERLLRASELRGEHWDLPGRGPVAHEYVREVWARDNGGAAPTSLFGWDTDGPRLYACLVLSRLVRDNNTSCEHAVRRLIDGDGTERLIPMPAFDSHVAYQLDPGENGWLDDGEAAELRELLKAYDARAFPERVGIGLRRAESVTRERFLEDALPLAVGAVESLLKVGRDYAKAQFCQRTPAVAAELGTSLTQVQAEDAYDDRSVLVHGAQVDLSKAHDRTAFEAGFVAIQDTLRAALRRAFEQAAFGAIFSQDSRITARWPVTVLKGNKILTL